MSDADRDAERQRARSFFGGNGWMIEYEGEFSPSIPMHPEQMKRFESLMTVTVPREKQKAKTIREPQKAFPWRKSRW